MAKGLIDYALGAIKDLIQTTCHEVFDVKSLWLFRHVPERKTWKSWKYVAINHKVKISWKEKSLQKEVGNKEIPELLGSIGNAFNVFTNSKEWLFIRNTFQAPEGTVIETDLRLGHQSVWFIPFCDGKNNVISILLVSLKLKAKKKEGDVKALRTVLEEKLFSKNSGEKKNVGRIVRLAYANKCLEERVRDFEELTIKYDVNDSPEDFLKKALLDPLVDSVRGTSVLPVIKIEGKQLKEPLIRYSEVVYDKLKQEFAKAIKNSGSKCENVVVSDFKEYLKSPKEIVYKGENVEITYYLFHDKDCDLFDSVQLPSAGFKDGFKDVKTIIKDLKLDGKTIAVVEKKLITERISLYFETINKGKPFYIVLDSGKSNDGKVSFDKELIACDIKDYVENSGHDMILGYPNSYDRLEGDKELIVTIFTDSKVDPFVQNRFVKEFIHQRYLYYKIIVERRRALQESIKSAKAAIMSRNMSHNLGSHVMVYLKQNLDSVENMVKKGVLEDLCARDASLEKMELPFLVGMGRFVSYLQERQDYIATVATDYIPYPTVVNFKDAIYDELKPELRYERHKNDNGGQTGRKMSNLLLDYIAYSEGIKSSKQIELLFGEHFRGTGEVDSDLRKFNVALPGGTMGRQAFFSIMENIIRNTAKHDGSGLEGKKLEFRFDILGQESFQTIEDFRYSGNGKPEEVRSAYLDNWNKYIYLGITSVVGTLDPLKILPGIEEGLKRDYISGSRMDDKYKGIKEMRISAAWMRRYNIDTEIPVNEPPALAARVIEGSLQYIVCLPQPKKVAFVVSEETMHVLLNKLSWSRERLENLLENNYCQAFLYENLMNSKGVKECGAADFDLVVFEDDYSKFSKLQPSFGSRVLKKEKDSIVEYIKQTVEGSFDEVYKEWLLKAFGMSDMPKISVLDPLGAKIKSDGLEVQNSDSSNNDEEFYKDCILFNSHYPGQPNLKDVGSKSLFAQARFVEAISGGNSTDRLMRRDGRDFVWYAKHVAAGLAKVAIFDERIYSLVMPEGNIEPKPFRDTVQSFFNENPYSESFNERNRRKWLQAFIECLIEKLGIDKDFARGKLYNCLMDYLSDCLKKKKPFDVSAVMELLINQLHVKVYSNAWKYREARIWAFNIRISKESVKIIGYSAPTTNMIGEYKEDYKEIVVAEFDKKHQLIPVDKKIEYKFDFITIHQGILDKIYDALDIDKKNIKGRNHITKELYRVFKMNATKGDYLPQLIIHSGRSKPNEEDMPQKQPFLQFSALDNAVKDCKYTLTELLYSAHYEQ